MTGLATWLAPVLLSSATPQPLLAASPIEEGGLDVVVEFCCRNASFRSSSAIFLSRSISSCRSFVVLAV